jgi:hypothetical protein
MRLTSISANRHIFEGRLNGKPLHLLLNFASGRSLRLAVAADAEGIIVDDQPLDEPADLGELGTIDIAEVTDFVGANLREAQVENVRALVLNGRRVGVQLALATSEPFHVWVDGDELHWGPSSALFEHHWIDGLAPTPGESLQV